MTETKELKALRAAIRAARMERGLSQEELARRSGVNRSYIPKIERGTLHPSFGMLVNIAKGLGMKLTELLRGVIC